jgi:DNA-binding response OmpR family regulator
VPGKPTAVSPRDTVLIVDDEQPVRQTLREWLQSADLGCEILTAADAEAALVLANNHPIDLAILDWNLGVGSDGLRLLEDLIVFHPDVVAILVTGYAHQATPLDALRMGVRDYFDKNQHFERDTFLAAVRRQLERIRPAKRERQVQRGLAEFREAVAKVLPLVQSAAALNNPLPLSDAIVGLFRFLLTTTNATSGALLVRGYDPDRQPSETYQAYNVDGTELPGPLVAFARSVAASVIALGEPSILRLEGNLGGTFDLQPFERGHHVLMASPLNIGGGWQVVLELFDKSTGDFGDGDRRLLAVAAELGSETLRQSLAARQTQRTLFDAVAAALNVAETAEASLSQARPEEPPPPDVMARLRVDLQAPGAALAADDSLRLAEAIRVLALRHGAPAVKHCIHLVTSLRELLDQSASD